MLYAKYVYNINSSYAEIADDIKKIVSGVCFSQETVATLSLSCNKLNTKVTCDSNSWQIIPGEDYAVITQESLLPIVAGNISWNGNIYLLLPSSGTTAYKSTDGYKWDILTIPTSTNKTVIADGSIFYWLNGTSLVSSNDNGDTWNSEGNCIGKYLCKFSSNVFFTSSGLFNISTGALGSIGYNANEIICNPIAALGGFFVCTKDSATNIGYLTYTVDCQTKITVSLPLSDWKEVVNKNNEVYVISTNYLYFSNDNINWYEIVLGNQDDFLSINVIKEYIVIEILNKTIASNDQFKTITTFVSTNRGSNIKYDKLAFKTRDHLPSYTSCLSVLSAFINPTMVDSEGNHRGIIVTPKQLIGVHKNLRTNYEFISNLQQPLNLSTGGVLHLVIGNETMFTLSSTLSGSVVGNNHDGGHSFVGGLIPISKQADFFLVEVHGDTVSSTSTIEDKTDIIEVTNTFISPAVYFINDNIYDLAQDVYLSSINLNTLGGKLKGDIKRTSNSLGSTGDAFLLTYVNDVAYKYFIYAYGVKRFLFPVPYDTRLN